MGQFGVSTMLGVGRFPVFGDPDHWFEMRSKATAELPLRAIVSFPNGRAMFDSLADAETYLEHPGDVKHAARYYLEHASHSSLPTEENVAMTTRSDADRG